MLWCNTPRKGGVAEIGFAYVAGCSHLQVTVLWWSLWPYFASRDTSSHHCSPCSSLLHTPQTLSVNNNLNLTFINYIANRQLGKSLWTQENRNKRWLSFWNSLNFWISRTTAGADLGFSRGGRMVGARQIFKKKSSKISSTFL